MPRSFRLFLGLSLSLIVLDQAVKAWARMATEGVEGRSIAALWPGVFELKLVYNEGVAFGMLQGLGIFLTPIAIFMACYAGWHSWKRPEDHPAVHITAAALAAGAMGNLVDRLAMGRVTDLFWFRPIDFPVFNVADMCITFAGAMLVIGSLVDVAQSAKKKSAEDGAPHAEP